MSPAGAGRSRRETAASNANTSAVDLLTDFGREQLALAMDASGAWWRGFETFRLIQHRAAQDASARHRAAARALRAASAPADLVAVPASLWEGDLQAAGRSWQELLGCCLEAQTEWLGSACSRWFDSATAMESVSAVEALDALPAAAPLRAKASRTKPRAPRAAKRR